MSNKPRAPGAALAALAAGAWLALAAGCGPPDAPAVQPSAATGSAEPSEPTDKSMPSSPVKLFADHDWYRDHPAEERRWQGVLRRRQAVAGPGSRLGLDFELDTGAATLPVYAARVEERLAPFAGRRVILRGKLVDLSDEGFGEEIWPAAVEPAAPDPKSHPR